MSRISRALAVQIGGLLTAIVAVCVLARFVDLVELITRLERWISDLGFWGGLLYPLCYALCNLLLLPGGALAIGSGLFFGLWWGFFLILGGNLLAAAIAFQIGRKLGRQRVERKVTRYRKWLVLDEAIAREGWKIIFLSQVNPLFPTSLLSYLYGITRIRFWPCLLWIALGQAPGLFLYSYLGTLAQLGLRLLRGKTQPTPGEYVIWIGGLVLTLVVTTLLARLALRLLAEAEQASQDSRRQRHDTFESYRL